MMDVGCRSGKKEKKNIFKEIYFTNGDSNIRYCTLWELKWKNGKGGFVNYPLA